MANLVSLNVRIANGQVLPATSVRAVSPFNVISIETVAGVFNDATIVSRVRIMDDDKVQDVEFYCTDTVAAIITSSNAALV